MVKPNINSDSEKELIKVEAQFKAHEDQINSLTMDRMNMAPRLEVEPQTKLAQSEIDKSNQFYLKPKRTISCRDKFNEKFRDQYNFDKEYVNFIAENKEIIGESITIWTRPYGGLPAEQWEVPVNKPVWGPRYLAEQIKRKSYHRLRTEERPVSIEGGMTYYGQMVVDTSIQRLDAQPVSSKKSVFMGANNF